LGINALAVGGYPLTKAGCKKVFCEVASGAKTDRAQLRRLLAQLAACDVLTVTRLDRLARSTRDLLNTLAAITGKKAGFKSLGDTWADTTTSHGRLMLTVLGGLAEFERDLIRARTGEGRARAVARAGRKWAGRSNSPITRSARRSSAATKASRLPTSPAATTSARRRFPA
jgi:DNA invertase Pin-like site-specific DNA recombinase